MMQFRLRRAFRRFEWLIVLGILLTLTGCGSSYNFPTGPVDSGKEAEDAPPKPKPVVTVAPPRPRNDLDEASETIPKSRVTRAADQPEKVDALPPLLPPPANYRDWNEHDFFVARVTGDPRLMQVLEDRVRNPRRTDEEAEQLASCLTFPPSGKPKYVFASNQPGERTATQKPADLILAVTTALGVNGTDTAREILGRILSGDLPVQDRQAGIDGALAALLRQASPKSEQVVFKILLAPPRLFASDEDGNVVDPLQKSLLTALGANASSDLRARLAKMIVSDPTTIAQRQTVLPILLTPNPLNLEAQTVIYRSPTADIATVAKLERQFAAINGEAMRTIFRFPEIQATYDPESPSNPVSSASSFSPSPETLQRASALLWNSSFVDFVDLQLHSVEKLADRPSTLALAATIPLETTRASLRRTLSRHWSEGPQSIQREGLGGKLLVEPGFFAVLKAAARANSSAKAAVPLDLTSSNFKKGTNPEAKAANAVQEDIWFKFRETIVRDFCRRCQAAAVAQSVADHRADAASQNKYSSADVPLLPPSSGEIDAVYRFPSPGENAQQSPWPADGTVKFYYLRAGIRTKLSRIMAFYRRQVKACVEHLLPGGVWIEGFTETAAENRACSTDVFISLPKAGNRLAANEEQELTVEALFIETGRTHE